jgi:predicted choloylglycine hydrolase
VRCPIVDGQVTFEDTLKLNTYALRVNDALNSLPDKPLKKDLEAFAKKISEASEVFEDSYYEDKPEMKEVVKHYKHALALLRKIENCSVRRLTKQTTKEQAHEMISDIEKLICLYSKEKDFDF